MKMILAAILLSGCAGGSMTPEQAAMIAAGFQNAGAIIAGSGPPQTAFTTRTGNTEYTTFSGGGSAFTTHNGGSSFTTFGE